MIENILVKLADIWQVFIHANGGLSYFFRKEASLSSFLILKKMEQLILPLKTVVDVGANQGQFARAISLFYPDAVIYSFEPVPETFAKLQRNLAEPERFRLFNFGLGNEDGDIIFYQNEHSHASSALPISDLQKREIPNTAKTREIRVPVKRLGDLWNCISLGSPSLLKLDVQGFEKQVLNGLGEDIAFFDYILFETSFVSMYDGEPLFEEMHSYVTSMGFEIVGPVGQLSTITGRIAQLDMLYRRVRANLY